MSQGQIAILREELQNGLFSKRGSFPEALKYAYKVIETFQGGDRIAALTALHVVMNTIAELLKDEEETE